MRLRTFLGWLLLASGSLLGQENRASILGRITDPTGAVVVGAKVEVENQDTGLVFTVVTNEAGNYLAPSLASGTYKVVAQSPGFRRAERSGLVLQIQQQVRLDLKLELGNTTETVDVTGAAPVLVTEDTTLGNVIDNKKVIELPVSGRSLSALTLLVPGASTSKGGTDNTLSRILSGGTALSANGMRPSTNLYTVDGASTNVALYNYPSFVPVIDSVDEFKVRTGNYSAEFGGYGGAHVDYSLKSGTNALHATLWEFLRNDAVDARNAFATSSKPILRQNQFGAMGSGRIARNRTFFMGTYQGFRRRQQEIQQGTVPTAAHRRGDLALNTDGRPFAAVNDPLTGRPFPGNQIPAARLSDTTQRAVAFYPLPNQIGGVNYRKLVPVPKDENSVLVKLDHSFSNNNRMSGRYAYLGNIEPDTRPVIADFGSVISARAQNVVLSDTHILSPITFFDARISWNRSFLFGRTPRNSSDNSFDARKSLNMVIPSSAAPGSIENGFPQFNIAGFSAVGDRPNGAPLQQPDENYQIIGAATALRANHKMKAGFEFRRTRSVRFRSQDNNGSLTFQPDNPAGSGNALGDFLLGLPRSTLINLYPMTVDMLQTQSHFYFADDWSIHPRVTLNLGLRYEYNTPLNEPYGRIPLVNLTAPGSITTLSPGAPLWVHDRNNFAPRIGIAYRPTDKFVIRSGYGIFYSEASWLHMDQLVLNPPFYIRQNFFATRETPLSAERPFPIGQLDVGGVPTVKGFDSGRRTAYVQTWSFNVQRSLASDLVVEAGYVGNHAVKMPRNILLNIPTPGPGNIQTRRPLQNFGPIDRFIRPDANSSYNSLQTRIEKRFSGGLSLLGSYTYMRSTDLSGNEQEGGTIDPSNLNRDWGLSDFFMKHRLSVSYVYELPVGRGKRFLNKGGIAEHALGGWQLSGVTVYRSGLPFTVTALGDRSNTGLGTRPNRTCNGNLSSGQTVGAWFDTSCFALPDLYTLGNSGRNILIGPRSQIWDVGVMKRFSLSDRHWLQFRAEMFNLWNNVNLGLPRSQLGVAGFGQVFASDDARSIQFALKYGF